MCQRTVRVPKGGACAKGRCVCQKERPHRKEKEAQELQNTVYQVNKLC